MPCFEEVRDFLSGFGLQAAVFEQPTPTAVAAAAVVGCSIAQIAKTMLVEMAGEPLIVVASGDARLNNSLLKKASGRSGKVRFCQSEQVADLLGYPPGGVCPFLLPQGLKVLLDESLRRFDIVYPAAGTIASAATVPVEMLPQLCAGTWAVTCKVQDGSPSRNC